MRDRGHVADGRDQEAGSLEGAQSRFTARTRTLHFHFQRVYAMLARLAARLFVADLGGLRRRLARAREAHHACRRPADGIALRVGDHQVFHETRLLQFLHFGGNRAFRLLHPGRHGIDVRPADRIGRLAVALDAVGGGRCGAGRQDEEGRGSGGACGKAAAQHGGRAVFKIFHGVPLFVRRAVTGLPSAFVQYIVHMI